MVGLGDLPGGSFSSRATGASSDGGVVVGFGDTDSGPEAFIWTQAEGMQRLIDVLVANGATGLDGWILTDAKAVSADGQWVVGSCHPTDSFGTEPFLAFIAPGDPDPDPSVHGNARPNRGGHALGVEIVDALVGEHVRLE